MSVCNGNFNLVSWLSGSNLLNNRRRAVQVNESLLNAHLKLILSLRTLPEGVFLLVSLGRHLNWSFHFEILFLCISDQNSTQLLRTLYLWLVRIILIWWITTSGSLCVSPVSLKAMAVGVASSGKGNSSESGAGLARTVLSCSCNHLPQKVLFFLRKRRHFPVTFYVLSRSGNS